MQDKQFMKEMLTESAHAYKAGRMDRRTFLALCGASGVAMNAGRAAHIMATRLKPALQRLHLVA